EIWDVYNVGKKIRKYYSVQYKYCYQYWQRGIPSTMESHLANGCSNCPQGEQKYWQDKIENRDNNYQRISKTKCQISTSWVGCGISFEIIDNLFMQDLFMQLNPAYHPSGQTILSGRILDEEIIKVNKEVSKILKKNDNLTLNREFLASEINTIITSIGLEKFAAIVTDSGSNCRVACRITNHDYLHIIDLRCIAHLINLIAEDFSKIAQVKTFIETSGYGLKDQTFHLASLTASNYWKALGYDEAKCIDLLIEFRKFIHHEDSYKVEFNSQKIDLQLSILNQWPKLQIYWLSEIQKELEHYKKDLSEELWACANITTIPIDLSSEADIISTNDIFDNYDSYIMNQNMHISVFISTSSDTFM
ncbi:19329_t:CDS:2, partial [Gigaspora margarita]